MVAGWAACAGLAGAAAAQLQRVEQARQDVGPLSTSTRNLPPDLRQENDFRYVYRVPASADSPYAGWFARRAGGLTAVFPRGQYDAARGGQRAVIPASTTFLIGAPGEFGPGATGGSASRGARAAGADGVDGSGRVDAGPIAQAVGGPIDTWVPVERERSGLVGEDRPLAGPGRRAAAAGPAGGAEPGSKAGGGGGESPGGDGVAGGGDRTGAATPEADERSFTLGVARLFGDPEYRDVRVGRLLRLARERAEPPAGSAGAAGAAGNGRGAGAAR